MTRSAGTSTPALVGNQVGRDRLSPAEAHDLMRQRIGGLAARWDLVPADAHRLIRQMRVLSYAPGEIILPRGVQADCLGLVVRGQVVVRSSELGGGRLQAVLLPGSTFGETMLTEGLASNATLLALGRCQIWFLRRADLEALASERQAARRVAALKRLLVWGAVVLVLWLAALALLFLPGSRQALALAPMSIGQLCYQQGYDTCAAQAWTVAATLSPADANPLLSLGALAFQQGEIGTAERYFQAAQTLIPDDPQVFNNLGLIYAHRGQHREAIVAFRQALEQEPGIAAAEYNLARSLQALQEYDEALDHYQLALSLGGPPAKTLTNMALAYLKVEQPAQAAQAAQEALRYDESLTPAYTVLGAVALQERRPTEALTYLNRAVAQDPAYGQAYFFLGLAYKSLGQSVEAISAFERALAAADGEITRVRIRRHLSELYEAERYDISP